MLKQIALTVLIASTMLLGSTAHAKPKFTPAQAAGAKIHKINSDIWDTQRKKYLDVLIDSWALDGRFKALASEIVDLGAAADEAYYVGMTISEADYNKIQDYITTITKAQSKLKDLTKSTGGVATYRDELDAADNTFNKTMLADLAKHDPVSFPISTPYDAVSDALYQLMVIDVRGNISQAKNSISATDNSILWDTYTTARDAAYKIIGE